MGERAKKKRAEESRARKAKKATEKAQLEDVPASKSNARALAAPSSRVPSSSAATRHSTRLLQASSSGKKSSGERTSADIHNDESVVVGTRPQRSATAAANALLQQLHIGGSECVDSEEDLDGKYNVRSMRKRWY